jgi:hypothetical protein
MVLVGVCFITSRTVLFSPDGASPAEKESKRLVSKFLQIGEYRIVVKM